MGSLNPGREDQSHGRIASMMSNIKIATWNLCLGLASKKELVKKYIHDNNLDVCCLQGTELYKNLNGELPTFLGYTL
jgi:hypothetical protein